MENMPYKIRYGAMDAVLIETDERLSEWYGNLENIQSRAAEFSEMKSFSGKTADCVKSYLSEVYTVINMGLGQAISDYQSKYLLYKNGYYGIESNIYAVMTASTMKWYFDRSAERQETQESLQKRVNSTLSSIADLVYLSRPSSYTLLSDLESVKTKNSELAKDIDDYENSACQGDLEELDRLIANVTRVIRTYKEDGHRIGNYKSGDYLQNMAVLDMARSVLESQKYVAENKNRIEEAGRHQNEVYDQMRADYEEACRQAAEARADKGGAEMIMGVVAVGVGVVCIFATAGAATPAVVAIGVTAGVGTTAYGMSQISEGAQDVYYGMNGDISTASFNPIRDTVFLGNQTAYDVWGTLNMTVAGIMIPGGKIVDNAVVAGATKAELAKTVAFTVGKELAVDTAADEIAGGISSHVQEKYGWGETATTILNLGLSFGIEKGIDSAFDAGYNKLKSGDSFDRQMYSGDAQRYNQWMNDHSGFAGEMDAEDAARYNVWRGECEAGTHNNHPGLSDYDIQQWNVADSHVQEQIALDKIDPDAYVRIRAEAEGKYGTPDIHQYQYNMIENPGPLAENGNAADAFYGGRYNVRVLDEDIVLYRAGDSKNPLGRWFTETPPESEIKSRIDYAIKPVWTDPDGRITGTSDLEKGYAIKIPKGTTVYEGPVRGQGGGFAGGPDIIQIYVPDIYKLPGVEVVDSFFLGH